MNDKLETMWMEVVVFQFSIQHSPGEMSKTMKSLRIFVVPSEILTCYFSDYSEGYCVT
jgi:hypothetical protein